MTKKTFRYIPCDFLINFKDNSYANNKKSYILTIYAITLTLVGCEATLTVFTKVEFWVCIMLNKNIFVAYAFECTTKMHRNTKMH